MTNHRPTCWASVLEALEFSSRSTKEKEKAVKMKWGGQDTEQHCSVLWAANLISVYGLQRNKATSYLKPDGLIAQSNE